MYPLLNKWLAVRRQLNSRGTFNDFSQPLRIRFLRWLLNVFLDGIIVEVI